MQGSRLCLADGDPVAQGEVGRDILAEQVAMVLHGLEDFADGGEGDALSDDALVFVVGEGLLHLADARTVVEHHLIELFLFGGGCVGAELCEATLILCSFIFLFSCSVFAGVRANSVGRSSLRGYLGRDEHPCEETSFIRKKHSKHCVVQLM